MGAEDKIQHAKESLKLERRIARVQDTLVVLLEHRTRILAALTGEPAA